jgi:hypothetical protein
MKKQLLILSLLISTATLSSLSFGEYVRISSDRDQEIFVDPSRIRERDGDVYFWSYQNNIQRNTSQEEYHQLDCGLLRSQTLVGRFFMQPDLSGELFGEINAEYPKWFYPAPRSAHEKALEWVCESIGE